MTKENFINKWASVYNVNDTTNPYFIADLEAVIATEIEKAKEQQPELNPIAEAYERGEKIRCKFWKKGTWAIKNSDTHAIDEKKVLYEVKLWDFKTNPENWEIYNEPPEQPAKPFDRERFEAMFRAVVASGPHWAYNYCINETEKALAKLDAYYASKEGGNNG